MDFRKYDTERAVNLLKLYKGQLDKQEEKSLRKAMDKLIEAMDSDLFYALLDIQEFYDHALTYIPNTSQTTYVQPTILQTEHAEVVEVKSKKEKTKKKRRSKSREVEDEEDGVVQNDFQETNVLQDHELYQGDNNYVDKVQEEENPWEYFEFELDKGEGGYGFGVAGGYDKPHYDGDIGIFVTRIVNGGSAAEDGRLRMDDAIVSVNETNLENVTHATAVNTLKNAGKHMKLVIRRLREDYYTNEEQYVADNAVPQESYEGYAYGGVENEEQLEEVINYEENYKFIKFEVILTKSPGVRGFGFSIQGGYDPDDPETENFVSVSRITSGGLAETDGRLMIDDIILMVNGQSMNGLTHEEAVGLLKSADKQVNMYVGRYVPIEEPPVQKSEKKKKKKHKREKREE